MTRNDARLIVEAIEELFDRKIEKALRKPCSPRDAAVLDGELATNREVLINLLMDIVLINLLMDIES